MEDLEEETDFSFSFVQSETLVSESEKKLNPEKENQELCKKNKELLDFSTNCDGKGHLFSKDNSEKLNLSTINTFVKKLKLGR